MPAWPRGPCPECGDHMPENLIHCQTCRALLNSDLQPDIVEIPAFVPLPEVANMVEVEPTGFYLGCPNCQQELRINKKYDGEQVQCKFCGGQFPFDTSGSQARLIAFYADCPHCEEELRAAVKYINSKVACKSCSGHIHFVQPVS